MTKEQKIQLLTEWKKTHDDLQAQYDALGKLFDQPTGKLFDASWQAFSAYTKVLSIVLGDQPDNLEWYCYENEFGKRKNESGLIGNTRPICNFEDLLWLIEVTA